MQGPVWGARPRSGPWAPAAPPGPAPPAARRRVSCRSRWGPPRRGRSAGSADGGSATGAAPAATARCKYFNRKIFSILICILLVCENIIDACACAIVAILCYFSPLAKLSSSSKITATTCRCTGNKCVMPSPASLFTRAGCRPTISAAGIEAESRSTVTTSGLASQ